MRYLEVWVFLLDGSPIPLECYPKGVGCQSNRSSFSKRDRGLHHKVKPKDGIGYNRTG